MPGDARSYNAGGAAAADHGHARGGHARRQQPPVPLFSDRLNASLALGLERKPETAVVGSTPLESGCDIVQFSAAIYFAAEAEGAVLVDVMRLGSLQGTVCASWQTCDGSAEAGVLYKASAGKLVFSSGEHIKTLHIPLVQNEAWAATLEFKISLSEAQNCAIGRSLHTARVKVLNADVFPTNKYAKSIAEGPDSIDQIPPMSLLIEFLKMNSEIPRVVRLTVLTLILDQMANAYFYFTLNVTMYITDVLFSDNPESVSFLPGISCSMFVPGNPEMSALCLAVLYSLPMVPIHLWEYARIGLDLKGTLRNSLRASLYRVYLNYTADSRKKVQAAEMQNALFDDVVEASQCYTHVVELLRIVIRLAIVLSFTLKENPRSWWILVLMPTLMACWIYCRGPVYLRVCDAEGDCQLRLAKFIHSTCDSFDIISEYCQRPKMNDLLDEELRLFTWRGRIPKQQIEMNNKYFPKWLGPVFLGLYISTAAKQVLDNRLTVGAFLATMNILRGIASDFGEAYNVLMSLNVLIGPLRSLVNLFNMPIDVTTLKESSDFRREMSKDARARVEQSSAECVLEDCIPLELISTSFIFSSGARLFKDMSLKVPQGTMIAVRNVSSVKGRSTLLKLLGQNIFPTEGHVFIPSHLRVLHVPHQPTMLGTGLWLNITFGLQDAPRERVEGVLSDLDMHDTLKYFEENEDEDSLSWQRRLSFSEIALVHLARAFVMSPEVTILSRPLAHFSSPRVRKLVMGMMTELVRNRGVRLPSETRHRRRPRTCFFSPETQAEATQADLVWTIQSDHSISVHENRSRSK